MPIVSWLQKHRCSGSSLGTTASELDPRTGRLNNSDGGQERPGITESVKQTSPPVYGSSESQASFPIGASQGTGDPSRRGPFDAEYHCAIFTVRSICN